MRPRSRVSRIATVSSVWFVLALCVGCSISEPAPLVRSDVPEGINDRFLDPELDAQEWVNRWEVESREIYTGRQDIVRAVAARAGDIIADVGSGTGLFLGPFSETVGASGKVYALDISPKFIEHLQQRTKEERLSNVEVILSGESSTKLPRASVDIVFLCDTYHHFEYHEAMLASIWETLRPGGQLVVIDFERIPGVSRDWVLGHVRAGKEQVRQEIEGVGFRYEGESELPVLVENYLIRFVRP